MIQATTRRRALFPRLAAGFAAVLLVGFWAPPVGAATTGINITLPLGHEIRGAVTDPDGHPVASAEVTAYSDTGGDARATTGADGRYAIHALQDGIYRVFVEPPRGANLFARWYGAPDSNPDGIGAVEVPVAGADVPGIDVSLEAGVALSGFLHDHDGLPVAGIVIGANGDSLNSQGTSGADGRFVIAGLREGAYTLVAIPPAGSDYVYGPVVDGVVGTQDQEPTPVDVGSAGTTGIDIEATRGFRLTGTVTWARGGQIEVRASGPTSASALTDANGHFVVRGLTPGEYNVDFIQPVPPLTAETGSFPLGMYPDPVEVVDADVALAPTVLPRGTDIVGRVVSSNGAGLANAYLFVCDIQGSKGCAAVNGAANGRFRVVSVPTGDFMIFESVPDHVQGYYGPGGFVLDWELAKPVHVVQGGPDVTGVTVLAPDGGSIAGRVSGPAGEPVVGARVLPTNVGLAPNTQLPTTDSTGRYVIRGLPTNQYRISVDAPSGTDYLRGYYAAGSPGSYTADFDAATPVRTIEAHDHTAPFVTVRDPLPGAAGVPVDTQISIRFSEPVSGLTASTVTLKDLDFGTLVPLDISFYAEYRTATLVPQATLRPDGRYRVTLESGIRDWSGNHLARTIWTFRTSP